MGERVCWHTGPYVVMIDRHPHFGHGRSALLCADCIRYARQAIASCGLVFRECLPPGSMLRRRAAAGEG